MRYIAILWLGIVTAFAKDKNATPPQQDAIEVVAHIPAAGGAVKRFLLTERYSSHYLYVEHDTGASATLIDVTKADHPAVLAELAYPLVAERESAVVVSGTSALGTRLSPQLAAPENVRIFDFSDPQHPKIAREFVGVTAIDRDDRRGLIFLANTEGIWILHQKHADDPEVEKSYAHHVIYDH